MFEKNNTISEKELSLFKIRKHFNVNRFSNLSYEFLFFEIQEILAANDKIFSEGNSQSAIFERKRLAVVAKSLEYHEDKLITQVSRGIYCKTDCNPFLKPHNGLEIIPTPDLSGMIDDDEEPEPHVEIQLIPTPDLTDMIEEADDISDFGDVRIEVVSGPDASEIIEIDDVPKACLHENRYFKISHVFASIKEAAWAILATEGFPLSKEEVYAKTVEGVQGTPELRKIARSAAKQYVEMFSLNVLRENKEINLSQYLVFKIKRISHAFGLVGQIPFLNEKKINLEGFCEDFTIPMIASSFKSYYQFLQQTSQTPHWLTEENVEWLLGNLLATLTSDTMGDNISSLIEELQSNQFKGPIIGGSGYDWHSTITGFIGQLAFHINRGMGYQNCGISIYTFPKREQIARELYIDILTRQHLNKEMFLNNKKTLSALFGDLAVVIGMTEQESGNCTYRSAEGLLYSLLAFTYLRFSHQDQLYKVIEDPRVVIKAYETVIGLFTGWHHYDLITIYNDLQLDLGKAESENSALYSIHQLLSTLVESSQVYKNLKSFLEKIKAS